MNIVFKNEEPSAAARAAVSDGFSQHSAALGAPAYEKEVLGKLSMGADTIQDLGNLYTAALPAWFAAGESLV